MGGSFGSVGELRDVHAAGYANFRHGRPPIRLLEPVARAFVDAGRKIVERGNAAFR